VGGTQDSRTTVQFDITSFLRPGENTVSVQVHGSHGQLGPKGIWPMSGIYRDVFLWSSPAVELIDHRLQAGLADDFSRGTLHLTTTLANHDAAAHAGTVKLELFSREGPVLFTRDVPYNTPANAEVKLDLSADTLPAIQAWSAENPVLYPYLITLLDEKGQVVAHFPGKTGFRRDEVKNGRLLHNGQPVLIKGVIRRDHNPRTGHALTENDLRGDLLQMKRTNLNAVRSDYAPNDPRFLELCDELGFYVFDEADLDSRVQGKPDVAVSEDPQAFDIYRQRLENLVQRDKNHPSVVAWSPGTAWGKSPNLSESVRYLHTLDPSRPVYYPEAGDDIPVDFLAPSAASLVSASAALQSEEKQPSEKRRPVIFSSYSRSGGNSSGDFSAYWDLFRKEASLQGGFIAEWRDQTIIRKKQDAPQPGPAISLSYGGDTSLVSGLMPAVLVATPQTEEVKKALQDVHTTLLDGATPTLKVKVFNERFFRSVDEVKGSWKLLKDGKEVAQGDLAIGTLAPRASADLVVSTNVQPDPAAEFILRVRYDLKEANAWYPAGMPIAWDELPLPAWGHRTPATPAPSATAATFTMESQRVQIVAGDISATIDQSDGALVSFKQKGEEILVSPLRLDFWRIPTQNDKAVPGTGREGQLWHHAGSAFKAVDLAAEQDGHDVTVRVKLAGPAGCGSANLAYRITGAGQIAVSAEFKPDTKAPPIPRIGMTCGIGSGVSNWTWFGKGPHENYEDRNSGAWTTVHTGMLPGTVPHYVIPQEAGSRTNVRWSTFESPRGGNGLRVDATGESLLEVSALSGLPDTYEQTSIVSELPKPEITTLHLDHRQMGVATDAKGLPADKTYRWSFLLTALRTEAPPALKSAGPSRQLPPGMRLPGQPGAPPPPNTAVPPGAPVSPKPPGPPHAPNPPVSKE